MCTAPGFRIGLSLVVAVVLTGGLAPAWGQMKAGEHIAVVVETPLDYAGVADGQAASVWTYELSHPGATYIAVHFSGFQLSAGDYLIVSDPQGGQAYTLEGRGKMDAGTFWAQHIKGDTVTLELVATGPAGAYGFDIDEYVAGFIDLGQPYEPEAICGADDKDNAVCYQTSHSTEYDRGRAVARLLIQGSGLCTGWLASGNDHLITNEHCITSAAAALNTDYEFMAEAPTCGSNNCQLCYPGAVFSGATFIQDSANLDYCLVQINSGNPAATYGYLEIDDRDAVVDEEIYILQHPGGRAKEFAIYSTHASDPGGICQVYSITQPPCSGSGYSDVGYYADTEGGSSGSPVLARSTHKVIALHHCANCPNRGVPIDLVWAEVGQYLETSGIKVTPADDLISEGQAGGPFTPGSLAYTIENKGQTPIDYIVTKVESWVSVSNASGTLAGGASVIVTVSIDASANGLPEGHYTDTVNFINTTDNDGNTTRLADLTVGIPAVVYEWNLDTDPGWTTEGQWAWGQPTGGGGQYGSPDPTSGATGTNVLGYNLSGDYGNSLPETHLTSAAINCSNLVDTTLSFQRWLGVEQPAYDHAYIRVSTDGTNWTDAWANDTQYNGGAWTLQEVDISAIADGQATVYLRWTMGTTDSSWKFCGWNIDDVQIVALGGVASCSDGVLNQGEDRIDCGGPCPPCACLSDAVCSNGLFCDGSEICDAFGQCQAGPAVTCDDGVGCTDDSCNEGTTSCDNIANDGLCDNGLYCDGTETCDALLDCQAGTAIDCDDSVGCTDDSCNEGTTSCDNIANDGLCDNGLYCDGAETCDALLDCQAGTAIDCDDFVGCTDDSCNEATDSCDNIANDGLCDNGLYCDGAETCDALLDCQAGPLYASDSAAGCTDDSCNEGTDSCDNIADDGLCDNGLYCDGAETCDVLLDCQLGGDPCLGGEWCDEAGGQCWDLCAAVGAFSCRDHGGGPLCLDLGLIDGIEPRFGGTTELEIDLADAAGFAGGVTVDCTPTTYVGSASCIAAGNTVTCTFSPGLPNETACTIILDCGASVCVRNLEGDSNLSGSTDPVDNNQRLLRFGQSAAAAGAEWDANADGNVDPVDSNQTLLRFGSSAPACP